MAEAVYVANETFAAELEDGTPIVVAKDRTHVREGSEELRRWPQFFTCLNEDAPEIRAATAPPADTEAATAAPGAKRGRGAAADKS